MIKRATERKTNAQLREENAWLRERLEKTEQSLSSLSGRESLPGQLDENHQKTKERNRLLIEDVPGYAVFGLDKNGYVESWNLGAKRMKGYSADEILGSPFSRFFTEEEKCCDAPAKLLQEAEETGRVERESWRIRRDGSRYWGHVVISAVRDQSGELIGYLVVSSDRTEQRKAQEKIESALKRETILRREIQHRVKNSIQIISSLLFLQSQEVTDPKMVRILQECQARARSIALVYGMLSHRDEIASIQFLEYVRSLIAGLAGAYEVHHDAVSFEVDSEAIALDLDTAVPCGLILTELVSNALKYAFPQGRKGRITIGLKREGQSDLILTCRDDGVGLPPGFNLEEKGSLGLRLVSDLVDQLHGKMELQSQPGQGTQVTIQFGV